MPAKRSKDWRQVTMGSIRIQDKNEWNLSYQRMRSKEYPESSSQLQEYVTTGGLWPGG